MSLPKEFPSQGLQALIRAAMGKPDAVAALGLYDIVGYGLFQAFGDLQYPMISDETPGHLANAMAQAPPEVQGFMDFANSNPQLAESPPPWLIPFAQQLAEYAMARLFDYLKTRENPTLFGMKLTETGGAFPERSNKVPSATGLFTKGTPSDSVQPPTAALSEKMQQPTGDVPEQHPAAPQSSKSPQFQANTNDPKNPKLAPSDPKKIPEAGAPASQPGGPPGPVTNPNSSAK